MEEKVEKTRPKDVAVVGGHAHAHSAIGGVKIIHIPLPKPKQRGWQFTGIQDGELVYIRRRWNKQKVRVLGTVGSGRNTVEGAFKISNKERVVEVT